jgi:transcriptional pleiotropic regulator of transition state genes
MKSTGIVRKLDSLRRLVIPKEICDTKGIGENTPMEIYIDGDRIILQKYESKNACTFCGEVNGTIQFAGKRICSNCIDKLCDIPASEIREAAVRA